MSEHDDSLFLTSPGATYPSPTGGTTIVSIAAAQPNSWMHDTAGGFTATAYWEPILPPEGYHYHFSLFTFGGTASGVFSEIFGIGFGGINGGLSMEQHRTEIDQANGIYQNTMLDFLPISAAQITGRIGMRLRFDDATNEMWTSFSLDGGATWQSPFPHGPVFVGRDTGQFLLSADPSSDAPPPCTEACCRAFADELTTSISLRSIGTDTVPGNDRLKVAATAMLPAQSAFADLDPLTDGARVVVRSQPSGTVLLDAAIPAGASGGRGTAGWRALGGGKAWTFSDKRSTAPDGVTRMTISDRSAVDGAGAVRIKLQAGGGTYPLPSSDTALDVAVVLGDAAAAIDGHCGARSFLGAECGRNSTGRSMKCKH